MSVLTINTKVTIPNGIDIVQIGSILQKFTNDYMYIMNEKLYHTPDFSNLERGYKLLGYDNSFKLINKSNTIYCYKKKLVKYLTFDKNKIPESKKTSGYQKNKIPESKKTSDESNMVINFSKNVIIEKDANKNLNPELDIKYLLSITKKNNVTNKKIKKSKGKNSEGKKSEIKKKNEPEKIGDSTPPWDEETRAYAREREEIDDPMTQARINNTQCIVEAIKQNRDKKKRKANLNVSNESDNDNKTDKVCSIVAGFLKTKAANRQKESEKESEKEITDLPEPVLPRFYSNRVEISTLPRDLRDCLLKKIFQTSEEYQIFYFNGAMIKISNGNIYDVDNVLNLPRLNPKTFAQTWDGKPGSLPIAQFKIIKYYYKIIITNKHVPHTLPNQNELFENFNIDENKIREFCKELISEYPDFIFGDIILDKFEDFQSVMIKVLEHPDCGLTPDFLYPIDLDEEHKLMFHLTI